VVAKITHKKIASSLAAFGAAIAALGATPAAAEGNDQAGQAVVQVASTVQIAGVAQISSETPTLQSGDSEFRELFSSWKSLDDGLGIAQAAPRVRVSIPSIMPVAVAAMTSGYGMRTHPVLGGRRNHKGIDLAAPTGTPVYATAEGFVSMAQWFSSYGKYVQIEHGADLQTRYAHLSSYVVEPGSRVQKGTLIGYVGSTGRSTGPHLHYEVRVNGIAVNPAPYMEDDGHDHSAMALADGVGAQGGPEEE
jgi:murein DD-endopeptidase MepM/ murein hydrolase activator NlpD